MTTRSISRNVNVRRAAPRLSADIAELVRSLAQALFDPYRPELYYMRGPGPRWHAKHDPPRACFDGVPALVPVRAR
jgi:hypothetical protein